MGRKGFKKTQSYEDTKWGKHDQLDIQIVATTLHGQSCVVAVNVQH